MEPKIYILKNESIEVHISDFGATLTRMITKDRKGEETDVLLGLEKGEDYVSPVYQKTGAYLGAVIGRYANRIAAGHFVLDGKEYQLAVNNGKNHLHGGWCGFDKKIWTVTACSSSSLALKYVSPDGEENYPGTLTVEVVFTLLKRGLQIDYRAVTDRDCYVNLTHHPYFNLNPEASDIKDLKLKLYTNRYLHTEDLIPDGGYVIATEEHNFESPRLLKDVIEKCGGLDDCYIFSATGKVSRVAELSSDKSGICLYVDTDYPGLQVYTGRYLNVRDAREGKSYGAYAGVALEAQFWPDSPNHSEFPSALLKAGEEYRKTTIYGFMEA